jgi:hypothetical protein
MIAEDGLEQGDYLRLFFGTDVLDEMCIGLTLSRHSSLFSAEKWWKSGHS